MRTLLCSIVAYVMYAACDRLGIELELFPAIYTSVGLVGALFIAVLMDLASINESNYKMETIKLMRKYGMDNIPKKK